MRKIKRERKTKAEVIFDQYKDLCLEKKEEREGYILSLRNARKVVGRVGSILMANRFLRDIDQVVHKHHLQSCFPYGQVFFHLKEMLVDKIEEMEKFK